MGSSYEAINQLSRSPGSIPDVTHSPALALRLLIGELHRHFGCFAIPPGCLQFLQPRLQRRKRVISQRQKAELQLYRRHL